MPRWPIPPGRSECFGQTGEEPAIEDTPLRPRSPYAVAKACLPALASWPTTNHRCALAGPARSSGNLDIWRDWGWAPDYVQAMALMLQADTPSDYLPRRPLRQRIWTIQR
jgi:GDPmannose 4,6-dehydratase